LTLDGVELAAIALIVLQREHPCQVEEDDEDTPTPDDEELAEIETVLLDSAVDVVIALSRVLKEQFAPEFDPFYYGLMKYTVLVLLAGLTCSRARMLLNGPWLWLV
jgi:hypothetical protein